RIDGNACGCELELCDACVDDGGHGVNAWGDRARLRDEMVCGEQLQREAHVHDLCGVPVAARDVHNVAVAEQVQPAPIGKPEAFDIGTQRLALRGELGETG